MSSTQLSILTDLYAKTVKDASGSMRRVWYEGAGKEDKATLTGLVDSIAAHETGDLDKAVNTLVSSGLMPSECKEGLVSIINDSADSINNIESYGTTSAQSNSTNMAAKCPYTYNNETLVIAPLRPMTAYMNYVFYGCKSLMAVDLDPTAELKSCRYMFYGCGLLKNAPPLSTANCTTMYYMFGGCTSLESVPAYDLSSCTDARDMFANCHSLTEIPTGFVVTDKTTSTESMFNGCSKLTSLDVSAWNMGSVTSCVSMFYGCSRLKSLDVSAWDMSSVTSCVNMFYGCTGLTSIKLGTMSSGAIINLDQTFRYCTSLKSLDMSGINLTGCYVGDDYSRTRNSFAGCSALEDFSLGVSPKIDWSLGASPLLTKESVINVLNSLYDFRTDEAYGYNEEIVGIAEGDDGFDDAYCGDGCGFAAGFVHPTLTLHSTVYNKIFVNDDCWVETDETVAELVNEAYLKGWLIA